jgi:hypothetical protein
MKSTVSSPGARLKELFSWARHHKLKASLIVVGSTLSFLQSLEWAGSRSVELYKKAATSFESPTVTNPRTQALEKKVSMPPTFRYKGKAAHQVRLEAPEGTVLDRDSLRYDFDWGDGFGNAWGAWAGEPQWSEDGRVVTRTYLHWKHDRGRTVTASARAVESPRNL